jgi:hypothetical protein
MLPVIGYLKSSFQSSLPMALTILTSMYLLGLVIITFLPETKGQPLPEENLSA